MSKEDRQKMISESMVIGFQLGKDNCSDSVVPSNKYDINKDPFYQGDMPDVR